jgi:hypothetical protein
MKAMQDQGDGGARPPEGAPPPGNGGDGAPLPAPTERPAG